MYKRQDYNTKDGTFVRDYIHIDDIISAFILIIDRKVWHEGFEIYNLGTNVGLTVKEIIDKSLPLLKQNFAFVSKLVETSRRGGDLHSTVSDASKARGILNWTPIKSIEEIITDTIVSYKSKNGSN